MVSEWVVTVYHGIEKVNSRVFHKLTAEEAETQSKQWIHDTHGDDTDWSLHKLAVKEN